MPRLDKHICAHTGRPQKTARLLLAQGRVSVDGEVARDTTQVIGKFNLVELDGDAISVRARRHYLKFHKPRGVVCATRDRTHQTVLDLIDHPDKDQLHLAGRLDYNSTGLVLLTNDGQWSRRLSHPSFGLVKRYQVTTQGRIGQECIEAFAKGMYFEFENLTTRPAGLQILDERTAEVTLREGRYHQIKRMFGRFNNKVLSIHRIAIGSYELGDLAPGDHLEFDPE